MIHAGIAHSFKVELLHGIHRPTDTYKIALYEGTADLSPDTTVYDPGHEVDAQGYDAGGIPLEHLDVVEDEGSVGYRWGRDPIWPRTSLVARGALIYNSSQQNRAVAVLDFGQDVQSTNAPFTIEFPAHGALVSVD